MTIFYEVLDGNQDGNILKFYHIYMFDLYSNDKQLGNNKLNLHRFSKILLTFWRYGFHDEHNKKFDLLEVDLILDSINNLQLKAEIVGFAEVHTVEILTTVISLLAQKKIGDLIHTSITLYTCTNKKQIDLELETFILQIYLICRRISRVYTVYINDSKNKQSHDSLAFYILHSMCYHFGMLLGFYLKIDNGVTNCNINAKIEDELTDT